MGSGVVTLGDNDIDTRIDRALHVVWTTDQRQRRHLFCFGCLHHGWWGADTAGKHIDGRFEHAINLSPLNFCRSNEPSSHAWLGRRRNVVPFDQALHEIFVTLGDLKFDGFARVIFGHARWEDQIDAKRFISDQGPDLGQFRGNLFRKATSRPVDTITPCL